MNPLDYKADIRVRCLISEDTDFTQGKIYECLCITNKGSAKVIDNDRDENYLWFGEYELVEDVK